MNESVYFNEVCVKIILMQGDLFGKKKIVKDFVYRVHNIQSTFKSENSVENYIYVHGNIYKLKAINLLSVRLHEEFHFQATERLIIIQTYFPI